MTDTSLPYLSATEIATAIQNRHVSPVEVVQAYLQRIDRLDPTMNAYITVLRDSVLARARQAEQALQRREASGPLFGVPMAVKDQFQVQGIPTTNGSKVYRNTVADTNATVVTRLQEAGALLLGTLNLSELAMGGTREPPWGIPRNPWDLERTPGESSSGSGVALAAHLCAASVGEDTGGSGRGPAAYCSVVGLRPTFTRVSRAGMTPMCWFMDTAAPMTKTVHDCALVLGAVAGYDPRDPTTSRRAVPDYTALLGRELRGLRVGIIRELHEHDDMHPEVRQAIGATLPVFRDLGADVRDVSIPLIALAGAMFVGVADTEGAGAHDDILRRCPEDLDGATRTRLQAAALVPAKAYNRAMKARVLLRQQFLAALQDVDILVSATSPYPPPKHTALTAPFTNADDVRARFFFRRAYTGSYALTALPGISVPCGFTTENLPIGLHLGARPFAEATLLQVAHAYEQATPWHKQRAPEW